MRILLILALLLPLSGCAAICGGYTLADLFRVPSAVEEAGDSIQPKRAQ